MRHCEFALVRLLDPLKTMHCKQAHTSNKTRNYETSTPKRLVLIRSGWLRPTLECSTLVGSCCGLLCVPVLRKLSVENVGLKNEKHFIY